MALHLPAFQIHEVTYMAIYSLQRDFNYGEHWCCALTSDNTMLFAINQNREYFILNKGDSKAKSLLSAFIANKNIMLSWDKKLNIWCRECFEEMPINMMLSTLVKNITYELACYRAGVRQVHVKDNVKNDCALQAQNILQIYNDYLYSKVYMILSLSKEYKINFLNTRPSAVIEKMPDLRPAYRKPVKQFYYQAPSFLRFDTPVFQKLFNDIVSHEFVVKGGSITHPCLPQTIEVGNITAKIGVGGLHGFSSDINRASDENNVLNDWDIHAFYPSMICKEPILQSIFGKDFVNEISKILEQRDKLRHTNTELSMGLKEVLNSATGNLNNTGSKMYNPQAYIQITLTGQLYILMIADTCIKHGIPVLSINTDGLTVLDNANATDTSEAIIKRAELMTGLVFEKTMFKKYYGNNVNNYLAFKSDNELKTRGSYSNKRELDKMNNNLAVNKLVVRVLSDGGEPAQYLKELKVEDFVNMASSNVSNESVRFYKAKNTQSIALRFANGVTIPKSDGCAIVNDFEPLETILHNIDYDYYLDQAQQFVNNIEPAWKKLISPIW